ncbi:hypothetical protein [Rhodococcus sp. AG1013]|uniref:hypothetical protein n=1 Tax=unclassified Rhodococcus (in: high G+C Gram-positive bacteria) TaxID=192944 RepID=UPI000E2B74D6|nr:hypothetical protein [Rhodococcus sp. AG1013]RDI35773.1 hypothetical protein DEU38_101253 [Rhodococcus sp. AG1013]
MTSTSSGDTAPVTLRFDGFRDPAVLSIDNGAAYLVDGVHERIPARLSTPPATGSLASLGPLFGS